MARLNRRLERLESTYQSADEYPPELVAEGFARLSDRDLALIEDYLYPEGIENAPNLRDIDWEQEPTEEQEAALAALAALIGDVRDEWRL